jgi:hypothetical protein
MDHLTSPQRWPPWLRHYAVGFVYWLVFLLALEPGNVLRAYQMDYPLPFGHELTRIVVAVLLGTTTSPLLLLLVRRFQILPQQHRKLR